MGDQISFLCTHTFMRWRMRVISLGIIAIYFEKICASVNNWENCQRKKSACRDKSELRLIHSIIWHPESHCHAKTQHFYAPITCSQCARWTLIMTTGRRFMWCVKLIILWIYMHSGCNEATLSMNAIIIWMGWRWHRNRCVHNQCVCVCVCHIAEKMWPFNSTATIVLSISYPATNVFLFQFASFQSVSVAEIAKYISLTWQK